MTPEPTPLVTVLPCDRLAVACFYGYDDGRPRVMASPEHARLAQAFARHRLAAREEAAKVADRGQRVVSRHEPTADQIHNEACVSIATAIRALSNKTGEGSGDNWQRIEDAIFEGLDANIASTKSNVRDLAKLLTARVIALSYKGGRDGE